MSGGGTTNLTEIPDYIAENHEALIDGGGNRSGNFPSGVLDYLLDSLNEGSPWEGVDPFDPTDLLDTISDAIDDYATEVSGLAPTTDWDTYFTAAEAEADNALADATDIDAAVAAFETDQKRNLVKSLNAASASLYGANAAEGSALLQVSAVLRRGNDAAIAEYRARLERERGTTRANFILQAINQMLGIKGSRTDGLRALGALRSAVNTDRINAETGFQDRGFDIAWNDRTYELRLFPYAGNILASGLNAPTIPQGPSKLSTALASGAAIAAQGVQLGQAVGPQGAVLGGVAGFAAGALAGLA